MYSVTATQKYKNHQNIGKRGRTYDIICDHNAKKTFAYFVQQELMYHNALVESLNAGLRAFPNHIVELVNEYAGLWAAVAEEAADLRKLSKVPFEQWPTNLKPFYTNVVDKNKNLVLNNTKLALMSIAGTQARVLPAMRKEMAVTILEHIRPQADMMNKYSDTEMKTPIQILPTYDIYNRRHIQLYRKHLKLKWDSEKQETTIHTPYAEKPIIVQEHNLVNIPWDSLLIRQTPDEAVDINSPWVITLCKENKYFITHQDNASRPSKKGFDMRGLLHNDRDR
jgi:hypothetical protein